MKNSLFPMGTSSIVVALVAIAGKAVPHNSQDEALIEALKTWDKTCPLKATIRMAFWDITPNNCKSCRDAKEQDVVLLPTNVRNNQVEPFLQGLKMAINRICRENQAIECLMPHDLISHKSLSVLKMKTPVIKGDYCHALMAQSRLGHLCLKDGGYRVLRAGRRPSQFTLAEWRAMDLNERYQWTYWYYALRGSPRLAEDDAQAARRSSVKEDSSPAPRPGSKKSSRTVQVSRLNSKTDRRQRDRKAPPPWRSW